MTTALIPDTLQGALILSLIDFLLSFVIISFIGLLLTGFPLLNRVAAWLDTRRKLDKVKVTTPQAPAPSVTSQDTPEEDIAAIMAAVAAVIKGEHHILHIGPTQHGANWVAAGRQAQHGSHQPPRVPGR
ncbi:OadG family transporter subunit [Rhodoferax sp. U11-2br]|uniref:OadG family transporter subunit n=1 Tax=Rhodoferax sp. U11-2br TaxID=2838878 RepID=UPI001BE52324|nr:OadG family transporter subunit [Rhodoferax sp. U11-2br]MBT3066470.1 hypothetical protein [Rhodoferax sp. U11-2br]